MKSLVLEPLYKFSSKGLRNHQSFKRHVDRAVREIYEIVGGEADIQIHVEPEVKSKGLFTLSISTDVSGKPVTVKKTGRKIYTLLKQTKKTVIKLFRRSFVKKIKAKRKSNDMNKTLLWGEAC